MLSLYVRTLDSSNDQLGETDQLANNIPTQIERIIRRSEGAKKKREMTVSSCYHLECRLSPSTDQSEHDQRKKQIRIYYCVYPDRFLYIASAPSSISLESGIVSSCPLVKYLPWPVKTQTRTSSLLAAHSRALPHWS